MPRACLLATGYIRQGRLRLADRPAFDRACQQLPDCRVVLRLEEHKDPRSVALNAYWWAVLINQISLETGMSEVEAHEEMKQLHLSRALVSMRGRGRIEGLRVFEVTTTDLSNEEEWGLIERTAQWSAETIDLVLPYPNSALVAA